MPSKLALITGASKGIGRATALELANDDLHLLVTARNEAQLNSLAQEVAQAGGSCTALRADLCNPQDLEQLVKKVESIQPEFAILVHSAGIARVGQVDKMNPDDWHETLKINLTIPFLLTQRCLPLMKRGAKIVFINSVAGKVTFADWAAYCAAKFGLRALADVLRQEVQKKGISITSIYPASVDTPMQEQLPYDWDTSKMLSPETVASAVAHIYRQPDDVCIKEIDLENNSGTF